MTPQEKAVELVDKFSVITDDYHRPSKKCALIAVDEIILECVYSGNFIAKPYWVNVKQEIEKL